MTCRAPRRAVTNVVLDFLKLQLLHAELRLRRRLHESKVKTVCAVAQPSLGSSEQPHPRARAWFARGVSLLLAQGQPWARAENNVSSTSFCLRSRFSCTAPCLLVDYTKAKLKQKSCQGRGHPLHVLMKTHVLIAQDQDSSRLVRPSQTPWWGDSSIARGKALRSRCNEPKADGETCQDPNVCARGVGAVAPGDALGPGGRQPPQDAEGPRCRSLPD